LPDLRYAAYKVLWLSILFSLRVPYFFL